MTSERQRIANAAPAHAAMVVFGLVLLAVAVFVDFSVYGKVLMFVPGLVFWTAGIGFFVVGEERA